jgi:hypothetical protein
MADTENVVSWYLASSQAQVCHADYGNNKSGLRYNAILYALEAQGGNAQSNIDIAAQL